MESTSHCSALMNCVTAVADHRKNRQKSKGIVALAISSALILLFLLYIGPRLGERIPYFQPIAQYIEEHEIEANMYFYTEVEAFSDAQVNMVNTMTHMPGQKSADNP